MLYGKSYSSLIAALSVLITQSLWLNVESSRITKLTKPLKYQSISLTPMDRTNQSNFLNKTLLDPSNRTKRQLCN